MLFELNANRITAISDGTDIGQIIEQSACTPPFIEPHLPRRSKTATCRVIGLIGLTICHVDNVMLWKIDLYSAVNPLQDTEALGAWIMKRCHLYLYIPVA